jgi:hypothetical protein
MSTVTRSELIAIQTYLEHRLPVEKDMTFMEWLTYRGWVWNGKDGFVEVFT